MERLKKYTKEEIKETLNYADYCMSLVGEVPSNDKKYKILEDMFNAVLEQM